MVAGLLLGLLRDLVRGLPLAQPLAEAAGAGSHVGERAVDTTAGTERLSSGVRVAIRVKKIKKIFLVDEKWENTFLSLSCVVLNLSAAGSEKENLLVSSGSTLILSAGEEADVPAETSSSITGAAVEYRPLFGLVLKRRAADPLERSRTVASRAHA